MSRVSVFMVYVVVVMAIFSIAGHLLDQAHAVAIFLMGASSSLFGHWLVNRNFD